MKFILELPIFSRIRRNHGLEHATIHVLSAKKKYRSMVGRSDLKGFWLIGDIPTEEVADAATEALKRLRSGERRLAISPDCGTNLATSGVAAGLGAFIGMVGVGRRWRDKFERLPLVVLLATIALIFAKPLGFRVQERVTTSGDPGDLTIIQVNRSSLGGVVAHRVITKG